MTTAATVIVLGTFPFNAIAATEGNGPGEEPRWRTPVLRCCSPASEPPDIIRRFDPPARRWLVGHRGVDLAAERGQEVHAAGPGTVGIARQIAGRGVVTILHADGLRTTYLPITASVRPGQSVRTGDVIGVVEATVGHCPTACLHWGLLRGSTYLDPLLLLGTGQVRLLPHWTDRLMIPPGLREDATLEASPQSTFAHEPLESDSASAAIHPNIERPAAADHAATQSSRFTSLISTTALIGATTLTTIPVDSN